MNKKILLTGAICIAFTTLIGCSEKTDNVLYNSLEKHVIHNVSYIKKEQLEVNLDLQSAISGSEKEFVVKIVSNANIMNKPSNDASIVGNVKAKESVLIIGNESIDGWYRVAYNGRICYVEGAKIDRNTLVADNGNNDADSNVNNGDISRPTSTTPPRRPVSTSSNSSRNTNTSSRGEEDDDETTTRGEGTLGSEENTTSGEEDTTTGVDGTTEDNSGSEGTTPEETTSSDSDVEDTTSEEEDSSLQEGSSSEQDTTSEEETTAPIETTEQSTVEDEHPSTEEQTTPQETEIVPFSLDEEAE